MKYIKLFENFDEVNLPIEDEKTGLLIDPYDLLDENDHNKLKDKYIDEEDKSGTDTEVTYTSAVASTIVKDGSHYYVVKYGTSKALAFKKFDNLFDCYEFAWNYYIDLIRKRHGRFNSQWANTKYFPLFILRKKEYEYKGSNKLHSLSGYEPKK